MIKDITLGQYYPAESPVHRLDPRTKIIATFVFIVSLFLVKSLTVFAFATFFLVSIVKLSKIPLRYLLRGLRPIIFIIIFTAVINLFMTPGTPIFQLGFVKVTKEGVYRMLFMSLRLTLLILGSSLLTLSTKPITLTDGMERLLAPLGKMGLPAHELAMMMTIALRFIPTLLDETDKIMKAQIARGADFDRGNIIKKAKNLIPILVPLFVGAFRIAGDLAMAMEARCYRGGEGRSRMTIMAFSSGDIISAVLLTVYFVLIVILGRFTLV